MPQVERWAPIPGWPGYEASTDGRIKSLARTRISKGGCIAPVKERVMKLSDGRHGYLSVHLARDAKRTQLYVHALVLSAFKGIRPEGMCACHINGDRTDNRLQNLKWGSYSENNGADKHNHGRSLRGERNHQAKLTEDQAREILHAPKGKVAALARKFGVASTTAQKIKKGLSWQFIACSVIVALLLSGCAADQQVRTITLPPRIEKQRLDPALVAPCPPAGDPQDATPLSVALWIPLILRERNCATFKLERIRAEVQP